MNDLLNTLFGLEGLGFGDEGVTFEWARPMPAWGWLLVVLGAGAVAWWSYWRLIGAARWRGALAGVRAFVILLVVSLICGPQLVRSKDRVETDWVIYLVDRSASMRIPDAESGGQRLTRDAQLRRAMEAHADALAEIARRKTTIWLGFDAGAFELDVPADAPTPQLDAPSGRRTLLGPSLSQALRRAAARPVSAVVVMSDGRSTGEIPRDAIRTLEAERIPVIVVPLGSPEPMGDVALAEAVGPSMAFVRDAVPIRTTIEHLGQVAPTGATVRLIDQVTGAVLDEQRVERQDFHDGEADVVLVARPEAEGRAAWRVVVESDAPDLLDDNNAGDVALELVDRPIRVLYFDGYPRWEYRYLKNLLLRERSITSTSQLLARSRHYIQEGDEPLAALPRTAEDWAKYDVIILGDVSAELFTREQLEQLREHVASRGAGLLWIAGEAATPESWAQTPLADLLPMVIGTSAAGSPSVRPWHEPVTMARTRLAERLGVLELDGQGWPSRLTDPLTGWSQLRWAQRIEPESLKPTAEILATGSPISPTGSPSGNEPLVISMRYGAGRVLYVATDEIWRWRYARGEDLPERFWLPLIRMQARESLALSARPAILEVTPRRALVDQPARIEVRLLDQSLVDLQPPSTSVRVRRVWPDPEIEPWPMVELRMGREDTGAHRQVTQSLSATWIPTEPGRYVVESTDPILADLDLSAQIEVVHPDDELRDPRTDHALLADLARRTGGAVLPPDRLGELASADYLPNREVRVIVPPDVQTLWDRWIVLILFISLLVVEWIGRKLMQLS